MQKRSVMLIILDGWGIGKEDDTNPVNIAKPETFSWLRKNFPLTSLRASGIAVGLPWGETGNSEVGHLTLGAGKVIYQYYPKITMAIQDGSFFENPVLKDAFAHARKNSSAVNFAGLLSRGNVHAALDHLLALIEMGEKENVPVKLHLFADGKDTPPKSVLKFLKEIPAEKIATLTGRYYAMDRSGKWQLTEQAYNNLVGKSGIIVVSPDEELEKVFSRDLSEEYLPPLRFGAGSEIKDGESLVFFNYREDSIRQTAEAFILKDFNEFPRENFQDLYIATFTHYEDKLTAPVVFDGDKVMEPLGKVISDAGKNQLRLAESYKYAHVTFFFNGYRESPFKNEYRILIPSLSTAKPEEHPELQAQAITDRLLETIQNPAFDFILVNYSNPDTMGHTANFEAGVEAVRTIDKELGRLLKSAINPDMAIIITSDHGNIEEMLDPTTGLPESQHDPNPVPLYLIAPEFKGKKFLNWQNIENETMGGLADVAPTILELLGIKQPPEMTGRSLLEGLI
ncbi:MAG: 2,3-bisphosphoglycerate-independent phosphoglycerate mutase [Patescibacteria group bacterium]|nr:2,3-bisphosphoglycerate-independent phosphoglycerate mutase [Patescibacteria group bacterium]MDE2015091.1 2,3-bisphosphoglycerate-independent phosphoglycerate mutase [Patescibacteria group bacterium]MDE2226519.1 2,3-bisphosphoglycerate-independent phosphoglycerate mutase [Patescibacteria group bacterium]